MTDDPMDIVWRLRRIVREERGYTMHQRHCLEAADEIERLRALITEWAEADIAWADAPEPWDPGTGKRFRDSVMALRKAVGR